MFVAGVNSRGLADAEGSSMTIAIAVLVAVYLAGVFAAFGGMSARNEGDTPTRMIVMVSSFSWLAFGYLACGGKLDADTESSPAETIKLPGNGAGYSSTPWEG
jgi:hypothetical protein